MNTINIVEGLTADGDSDPVHLEGGQYAIAVSGNLGGGTVQLKANVGVCEGVPIIGAAYTAEGIEIVWLPPCTAFVTLTGGFSPDVNVALAELSTKLD